jgi:tRNA threonylcarbamoyladenosine biosynthesis protein TsaE
VGAISVVTHSPEETRIVGAALAPLLIPGDVISLTGDLGAGKTVFVQGLAGALGVESRVTSPSFIIVREYRGRYPLVHIDVYRLTSFQEVLDLGFDELLDPEAILAVEWGEAVAPMLPLRYLEVEIRSAPGQVGDDRVLVFRPRGDEWRRKLEGMRVTAETLLDAMSPQESTGERFTDVPNRGPREWTGPPDAGQ